MKSILTLALSSILAITSFGQNKVKYTGLNKSIPDNIDVGIKSSANLYFSSFKIIEDDAILAEIRASENLGGGLGFFGHFEFSKLVGLQTELNFNYRAGNSTNYRQYDVDTARTIYKEDLLNFSTVSIEIPVYLKFRWEFTPIRQGHWKAKSQLGLYFGPRLVLNPFSKSELSRATTTRIYDNTSLLIQNGLTAGNKYNSFASFGAAIGLDYELWNGFIVHAAYYRGFTSHLRKTTGIKAFDNRLEFGIGYRFN